MYRLGSFECPACKVIFALREAADAWDEELEYDVGQWLASCVDSEAGRRAAPGRCKHLKSVLIERGL